MTGIGLVAELFNIHPSSQFTDDIEAILVTFNGVDIATGFRAGKEYA